MHRVLLKYAISFLGALLSIVIWAAPVSAQMVDGIYYDTDETGGQITLTLRQNLNGDISGDIIGNGKKFEIRARIEKDVVIGQMFNNHGRMAFEAELTGTELGLSIFGILPTGRIDHDDVTDFAFLRQGARLPAKDDQTKDNFAIRDKVRALSSTQQDQLMQQRRIARQRVLARQRSMSKMANRTGRTSGSVLLRSKDKRQAEKDPLNGTYSSDLMTLKLAGANGTYHGSAIYNGRTYPLKLTGKSGRYSGYYMNRGEPRPIQLSTAKGKMTVLTAANKFQLRKEITRPGSAGKIANNNSLQRPAAASPRLNSKSPRQSDDWARLESRLAKQGSWKQRASARPGHINLGKQRQIAAFKNSNNDSQQWSNWLSDKKIEAITNSASKTANGNRGPVEVHLCADGKFVLRGRSPRAAATGTAGSFNRMGDGNWTVVKNGPRVGVRLAFGNGQIELYEMQQNNGKTFANGEPVNVAASRQCR